ncbi:MAG: bifunctional nuclease family protein [Spirochaetia bacterium]|nr:bifunctional nuclease family protein [Spirochaetia bacterium]
MADNLMEVTISDVSITNVGFAIFLKPTDIESQRVVPIFIGPLETYSISSALDGVTPPRPNTHDLIISMLNEMEARVLHVIINDIIGNIFYARIVIQTEDGVLELDSRPSDSVAIAIRSKCPIYVNEKVYRESSVVLGEENKEKGDQVESEIREEIEKRESSQENVYRLTGGITSEIEDLKKELQKAVDEENFEEAARLRDLINSKVQEN